MNVGTLPGQFQRKLPLSAAKIQNLALLQGNIQIGKILSQGGQTQLAFGSIVNRLAKSGGDIVEITVGNLVAAINRALCAHYCIVCHGLGESSAMSQWMTSLQWQLIWVGDGYKSVLAGFGVIVKWGDRVFST